MKGSSFILVSALFTVALSVRLDFNGLECNNYLKKFGTANSVNGVGPTSLAFTGNTAFVTGTSNVQVNLRYSDSLYNDATYWGLTQEDGKTAEATCLDLKLWKFTSSNYTGGVQVTDLPFNATSDLNKKWRSISFTINGAELPTRLVQTSNNYQYIYTGYYAAAYYAAGTTLVQYIYYFQFSVTIHRNTGQAISSAFKPLSQFETVGCTIDGGCILTTTSKLNWCTDPSCTNNTIPALNLNDQFYLQQVITTKELTNYFLINTTVYYVGNGLNKLTMPVSINNTIAGQTVLLLTADIAWSNISIQVTSYLSTTTALSRRFLQKTITTYDPINGKTETIECIKLQKSDLTCASCAQQLFGNDYGIAESSCYYKPVCCFSILATTMSILFLIII